MAPSEIPKSPFKQPPDWVIELVHAMYADNIDQSDADDLTSWIMNGRQNFESAKCYIRELRCDQDYGTGGEQILALRKLLDDTYDMRELSRRPRQSPDLDRNKILQLCEVIADIEDEAPEIEDDVEVLNPLGMIPRVNGVAPHSVVRKHIDLIEALASLNAQSTPSGVNTTTGVNTTSHNSSRFSTLRGKMSLHSIGEDNQDSTAKTKKDKTPGKRTAAMGFFTFKHNVLKNMRNPSLKPENDSTRNTVPATSPQPSSETCSTLVNSVESAKFMRASNSVGSKTGTSDLDDAQSSDEVERFEPRLAGAPPRKKPTMRSGTAGAFASSRPRTRAATLSVILDEHLLSNGVESGKFQMASPVRDTPDRPEPLNSSRSFHPSPSSTPFPPTPHYAHLDGDKKRFDSGHGLIQNETMESGVLGKTDHYVTGSSVSLIASDRNKLAILEGSYRSPDPGLVVNAAATRTPHHQEFEESLEELQELVQPEGELQQYNRMSYQTISSDDSDGYAQAQAHLRRYEENSSYAMQSGYRMPLDDMAYYGRPTSELVQDSDYENDRPSSRDNASTYESLYEYFNGRFVGEGDYSSEYDHDAISDNGDAYLRPPFQNQYQRGGLATNAYEQGATYANENIRRASIITEFGSDSANNEGVSYSEYDQGNAFELDNQLAALELRDSYQDITPIAMGRVAINAGGDDQTTPTAARHPHQSTSQTPNEQRTEADDKPAGQVESYRSESFAAPRPQTSLHNVEGVISAVENGNRMSRALSPGFVATVLSVATIFPPSPGHARSTQLALDLANAAQAYMEDALERARANLDDVPAVNWASLSIMDRFWRTTNEHILVAIYGANDTLLTPGDIQHVNRIATALNDGVDNLPGFEWMGRMFRPPRAFE